MNTSTLSIRLDKDLKNKSKIVSEKLGLDISSLTKMFYVYVVEHEAIPFQVKTINGYSKELEDDVLNISKEIKKNRKKYKTYSNVNEISKLLNFTEQNKTKTKTKRK